MFGEIPPDVAYKCGDTSITFQSTALKAVGSFGPPLIPFPFPVVDDNTEKDKVIVDFKYESPDNKTKVINALIITDNKKIDPVTKMTLETKVKSLSMFRYSYGLKWQNVESFMFQLETSDPNCGILTVPYNKDFHVTYSMI